MIPWESLSIYLIISFFMKNIDIITLEERKKIALNILIYFDKICKEKKIKYFLAYGTLLGAVRHKGFIPWDDDIDIMMPREDYNKLFKEFPLNNKYEFMDIRKDWKYGRLFGVINDKRTIKNEKLLRKRSLHSMSINIDIFPMDSLPDKLYDQKKLLKKVRKIENKMACLTYSLGKGRNFLSTIKKNLAIVLMRSLETLKIVSISNYYKKHHNLFTKFQENNYIGSLTNTGFNGLKEFLPKRYFEESILLDFEGYKFQAPKYYDKILTQIYGDYMKLPPIEKRRTHHTNNCYWKIKTT